MKFYIRIGDIREAAASDLKSAKIRLFSEQEEDFYGRKAFVCRLVATGHVEIRPNIEDVDSCVQAAISDFKEVILSEIRNAPIRHEKNPMTRVREAELEPT